MKKTSNFAFKHSTYIIAVLCIMVVLCGAFLVTTPPPKQVDSQSHFVDHNIAQLIFDQGPTLAVEVVSTPESITQGLSGRESIGAEGMLFVFDKPGIYTFWMKEMQFDLDLIWLRKRTIVGITPNVPKPEPGTTESQLPTYEPPQIVDMVLEVPAGSAEKWQLHTGSSFTLGN